MQFDFWVNGDTPDTDGDDDGFLEDYYQLSIMDLNALAWHASSNAPAYEGDSYWCADESVGSSGGYLDEWMQYLDTPLISVNDGDVLECDIKFEIEDEAGAVLLLDPYCLPLHLLRCLLHLRCSYICVSLPSIREGQGYEKELHINSAM